MSENNPNTPGDSVPPKPPEAAKVQPKKETVRISLPPKPTASPTIKLPTLPAGGPAVGAAPAAPAAPATSGGAAPAAPRPPTAGSPGLAVAGAAPAAPASAARPATNTGAPAPRPPGATAGAPRPAASAGARKISGLDMGLGIAAAVVGVGAVVCIALLLGLK